ncbi:GWxTD domain-containing protein [Candidatus Aminicenantes bacterium AC-708-M15]|jgi:GWxTD domain-containing protein|nr:GWxTD domain-containing protein [SCandidatus Aminicenantes bacterium Aminicenantia_JdfR_composite]MCP2597476.1 GWxTD domain-containing protein [Candidatus Aminicenantes bacterium AC-335-G13]MCP2604345.1 GWxTD domain-containing protein [Candidatus Aminicenantes bacterium AC-708-M15]
MRYKILIFFTIFIVLFILNRCATFKTYEELDPKSKEFLSTVRYIITSEEEKIFKELPPSERPKFIEDFWARRDPTPGTLKNEFKETYFRRIEEANQLFRGARPGWLQDRGRIYILFGPPDERITNPMGGRPIDAYVDPQQMVESERYARGEKPTEIWVYYNLFSSFQRPHIVRLVFVDEYGTGDYKLATNIEEVIAGKIPTFIGPNLWFLHEYNKEEAIRIQQQMRKALFDFNWQFIPQKNKELNSNLLIRIEMPYEKIIYMVEDNYYKAKLNLLIEVKDEKNNKIWSFLKDYELILTKREFDKRKQESWVLEIPIKYWFGKGIYSFYISLRNISGDQEVKKLLYHKI